MLNIRAWWAVLGVWLPISVAASEANYQLAVNVTQKDKTFLTEVSFRIPLNGCQSWEFLTDYASAKQLPGIIESSFTRISENKVRVHRVFEDRVWWMPLRIESVVEYSEIPNEGHDFVQIEGDFKSYRGSWRLTPEGDTTVFRYASVAEPDSSIPKPIIRYVMQERMHRSFLAMAQYGASRQSMTCRNK